MFSANKEIQSFPNVYLLVFFLVNLLLSKHFKVSNTTRVFADFYSERFPHCCRQQRVYCASVVVTWPPQPLPLSPRLSPAGTESALHHPDRRAAHPAAQSRDDGTHPPAHGLVQVALLEGGDGADAGGTAVLWKNHFCQRYRCKSSLIPEFKHWSLTELFMLLLSCHSLTGGAEQWRLSLFIWVIRNMGVIFFFFWRFDVIEWRFRLYMKYKFQTCSSFSMFEDCFQYYDF